MFSNITRYILLLTIFTSLLCGASSWIPEEADVLPGFDVGYGTMKNNDGSIGKRRMITYAPWIMPGYRFYDKWIFPEIMPALFFEYRYMGQLTNVNKVGNSNMQGTGYNLGLGVRAKLPWYNLSVLGALELFGSHKLNIETALGQEIEYGDRRGIRLGVSYDLLESLAVHLSVQYARFDKYEIDGSDRKLNSNSRLYEASLRLGVIIYEFSLSKIRGKVEEPVKEPEPPAPPEPQKVVKLVLSEELITFEVGKYSLSEDSKTYLENFSKLLIKNKEKWKHITVTGHTDNRGSPEINLKLSQQRAKSVFDELVKNGIEKERLSHKGYGSSRPVKDENTPEAWSMNRRVEFEFSGLTDKDFFKTSDEKTENEVATEEEKEEETKENVEDEKKKEPEIKKEEKPTEEPKEETLKDEASSEEAPAKETKAHMDQQLDQELDQKSTH